ncbi:MAG: CPBP family intramembrane metalloprotease [Bacteroidales bacterium]|nr:CPBP family intramembrane metalloprotease [Bacteroidales bacterium]
MSADPRPRVIGLSPFAMLIFSTLSIIVIGLVFQLIAMLTAPLLFDITIYDLLEMDNLDAPGKISAMKWLQIVGALGTFIFSSFFLSFLYTGSWTGFFVFGKKVDMRAVIILAGIMLTALPFVNWLTEMNMKLELPFERLDNYLRQLEEQTESLMMTLLRADHIWTLLLNLFMIAIIPAVGEELVFRGIIQKHFQAWFKNGHAAVIVTAVIFSLAHFQVYSFLPRFFLGILLGYMLYYGRSIWYPMIAHLVNNGLGVVFYYYHFKGAADETLDEIGTMELLPVTAIISILLVAGLMYIWTRGFTGNRFLRSG